jgi:AcrR family transcriptional regulator
MSARRSRGEARRGEILAAARATLVEHGLDQFVLRGIANRVGIELGNLQYYFTTRADLLEAVIRAEFEHDVAAVRTARQQLEESPNAGYAHLATWLIRNWTVEGGGSIFTTLWQLSYHDDRFRRLSAEIYETFYAEIQAMIRTVDASAADHDLATRARLMTAILDGVAMQIHVAPSEEEPSRRDLLTAATELLHWVASGATRRARRALPTKSPHRSTP